MLEQLKGTTAKTLVVQGIPGSDIKKTTSGNVEIISHLDAQDLEKVLNKVSMILSRPGYSSLMDLAALGKKAVFVPTPGQTEQEYLAKRLMGLGIAYSMGQGEFNLETALASSSNYKGFGMFKKSGETFQQAVGDFLRHI